VFKNIRKQYAGLRHSSDEFTLRLNTTTVHVAFLDDKAALNFSAKWLALLLRIRDVPH
jgi:hypothetical protein